MLLKYNQHFLGGIHYAHEVSWLIGWAGKLRSYGRSAWGKRNISFFLSFFFFFFFCKQRATWNKNMKYISHLNAPLYFEHVLPTN